MSEILRKQFRPNDVIVRYGGDEFAVLLPDVDAELGLAIAERVRRAVSGKTADDEDSLIQIPIRVSMGVAALDRGGDLEDLIKAADAALYRAKRAGRDLVSN